MVSLCLRRAAVGDAERIGRFQTRCWDQAYRGLVPDSYLESTTWQVRAFRWRDRIASGARHVWLARLDTELVGVASTAIIPADRSDLPGLELCSIYVDEMAHGRGVAAELLYAAIADNPAHLWVFALNIRAQRFYAKHRFNATTEARVDPETGIEEVRWVRR